MGGNVVLTAAHCITDVESPLNYVSFDLEMPTEFDPSYGDRGARSAKSRLITRTFLHEGFDRTRFSRKYVNIEPSQPLNDVALLTFQGPPPSDAHAVHLIAPGFGLLPGSAITIAGFGRSDAGGGDYGRLYKVDTHVGDLRNRSLEIVDGPNVDKGSCVGDSGGPVIVSGPPDRSGRRKLTVTGIVSYGPSDCETGTGFNTDLRYFQKWVSSNLASLAAGGLPVGAKARDMATFVPTAEGSFFQMCMDRHRLPDDSHTIEVVLSKLGASDCTSAAELALRVTELDLSGESIKRIDALRHFVALERLDLSHNRVEELEPISYLTNLKELNLEDAGIDWKAFRHPAQRNGSDLMEFLHVMASPLRPSELQARRDSPYTQGIWLTALKDLRILQLGPEKADLTIRYAGKN
jgi:hypothetical protein